MRQEEKPAFVIAQAACAMIEAIGMQAENAKRLSEEKAPAYGEEEFAALIDRYGIAHNAVIRFIDFQ